MPGVPQNTSFEMADPAILTWAQSFIPVSREELRREPVEFPFPEEFGKGFAVVGCADKHITFRMVHYRTLADLVYTAVPTEKYFLILHFYQYSNLQHLTYHADKDILIDSAEKTYSMLIMTSSKCREELHVSEKTLCKGITLNVGAEWLEKRVKFENMNGLAFFEEKKPFPAMLSPRLQRIITELFDQKKKKPSRYLYYQTRVLRLLEIFLESVLDKEFSTAVSRIPNNDIESLLRVERYLTEFYSQGFPGLEKLAQQAFMSATKLKTTFKKAYGMTVYEYFQKHRLQKAKEMLSTHQYSIADVALQSGYKSFSNFSAAYKKEFGYLPSEFARHEDGI